MGKLLSLQLNLKGKRNKLPGSQMLLAPAIKTTNEEWIRDERTIDQHKYVWSSTKTIPNNYDTIQNILKFLQATVLMTKCLSGISKEHLLHLLSTKAPWIQLRWIFPFDLPTVWSIKQNNIAGNVNLIENPSSKSMKWNNRVHSEVEGIKSNVALTSTKPLTLQRLQDQKSTQNWLRPVLHSWQEHAWGHDELDCNTGGFNIPKSHQSRKK